MNACLASKIVTLICTESSKNSEKDPDAAPFTVIFPRYDISSINSLFTDRMIHCTSFCFQHNCLVTLNRLVVDKADSLLAFYMMNFAIAATVVR